MIVLLLSLLAHVVLAQPLDKPQYIALMDIYNLGSSICLRRMFFLMFFLVRLHERDIVPAIQSDFGMFWLRIELR